jgi:hypothetical protein
MTPGIEAVLHFASVIEVIESPVTKGNDHDDRDDRSDVAAAA